MEGNSLYVTYSSKKKFFIYNIIFFPQTSNALILAQGTGHRALGTYFDCPNLTNSI